MSKYVAKAALRQAKNYTKGYSEIQIKVREATSNDPWGPSGSQMAELAEYTFNAQDFMEIMDLIDKRLNDSGKNWRHVYKALTLLDYLICCGSQQVVTYAKQNLYVIKTLKEFQFIDDEGRDQGANVREKSKAVATLLTDEDRLKEARNKRRSVHERLTRHTPSDSGSRYNSSSNGHSLDRRTSLGVPSSIDEEERQLERAIEESKRMAAAEAERRSQRSVESRESSAVSNSLNRAISTHHAVNASVSSAPADIDLWGNTDNKSHELDFFSSMASTAPVQQNQPDPFGLQMADQSGLAMQVANPQLLAQQQQQQQLNMLISSPSSSSLMNYGTLPHQQSQPQITAAAFGYSNPYGTMGGNAASMRPGSSFSGVGSVGSAGYAPASGNSGLISLDGGFDSGAAQRNLVPKYVQSPMNPNAQLAQIARNSNQIDPFSSLAAGNASAKSSMSRSQQPSAGLGDMYAGSSAQQQHQPVFPSSMSGSGSKGVNPAAGLKPSLSGNDPFASLSPFAMKSGTPSNSAATLPKQQSLAAAGGGLPLAALSAQSMGQYGQQQQKQSQQQPAQQQQQLSNDNLFF